MIDIDRIKENHKEFIKSNKSALKTKQLKLKEVNYDKRMQSMDSIETCIWKEKRSSK